MTFSEWVAHENHPEPGDYDPAELGRCLRRLHDELLAFSGELGDLGDVRDDIERLHRLLGPTPTVDAQMIDSLRERLSALDWVFRSSQPAQTLHGDVSLTNLFRTAGGYVWNDFEDTFRGPVA
jgi:Ser/Thr protein kinase RdoA (MazF antagonist)